jgi:hypothetical protein
MESEPMASKRLEIELPQELFDGLLEVANWVGTRDIAEAALMAVADWVARRKAELDDRDPDQKYFVNEALDELATRKK